MKLLIFLMINSLPMLISGQPVAEVVQLAMDNNKQLKAAHFLSQSAQSEMQSTTRTQLPAFSLKGSYAYVTDAPQIEFPPAISPFLNGPITLNPKDNYETSIQMDYLLFSGFAQSQSIKVKEFEHKISLVNKNQEEKEIAINVVQAYRNAQFMRLSLDILEKAKKRNNLHMQNVLALLENGMALQLDTLSLALNRMEIEQQIIQSKAVLENWLQLLETISGVKVDPLEFTETQGSIISDNYVPEGQNPFKSVLLQQQKMMAFKKITMANYYPRIWLSASFNYGKPGIDIIQNEWSTYGKWMIGLQWNIWNWGADYASVQSRELQYKALQLSGEDIQDQLKLQYDKAVRSFNALNEQLAVTKQAVKVAHEKMQIVEIRAKNGQLSATDFNDANLELSQTELKEKQLLIQLNLQANEIDFLSGKPVTNWRF
jgi:outer membrane protein TolC